jgi:hypothetical protein
MTWRRRGLPLALVSALLIAAPAWSQTPPCPGGGGVVTASAVGTDVLREGAGFGAVSVGGTVTDLERAWGPPARCHRLQRSVSHEYLLMDDPGQHALMLIVFSDGGLVQGLFVSLTPHGGGQGPPVRTARGVAMLAAIDDVRATYGAPADAAARAWVYAADGVAFTHAKQLVTGIAIFKPGTPLEILQP